MKKLLILLTFLILGFTQYSFAQKVTITGVITDSSGPLPGATVIIKDTTVGTTSDFDGNYSIEANIGDTLVFSFVGFASKEIVVVNITKIDVILEADNVLDEVIITAQGIKKEKKALGYAITQVSGDELKEKAEADVARTLQGKVAGVQITASSGSTGNPPSVRIRSSLSLNQSNSPLIIVNSVPFSGSLIDIDANDIQSLNVLKGLNASILYGSEGRNGVILIQTKSGSVASGKAEKVKVSLSQTGYTNTISNLPEYQNKYGQGSNGNFVAGNVGTWGPAFTELDVVPHPLSGNSSFPEFANATVPYEAARNNVEDFFRTGIGTITSLNISSSQEKTAFNMSVGYTDEEGIIGNNNLKRFNLGIGGSAKLSDKLDVSATLNYSTRKRNSQSGSQIFERLLYLPRSINVYDLPFQDPITGENVYYRTDQNPLWTINNTGRKDDIVRVFGTVNANYKINDNLRLNYRVGYDSDTEDEFDFWNKGGLDDEAVNGALELDYNKEVVVDQSVILSTNFDLSKKIGLDAQIGINSKYSKFKSNASRYENQIVYGFLRPRNFSAPLSDEDENENTRITENLAGAFGQFEFSYDNYFYLTLSGRNDWGSTVEPENRELFYPGVSMSFIPSSAFNFYSGMVNYLKLRGAYATSSGYPSPYRTRTALSSNPQDFITNSGEGVITNGVPSRLGNPNLKPELHREFELGLEAKFINNRVTLETSVFKRISEDQIIERELSGSTGFAITEDNIGEIQTEGIEIDLGIDIIKSENINFNVRNIFTAYETIVTELNSDQLDLGGRNFAIQGQPLNILVGTFVPRDSEGNFLINPDTGELLESDAVGFEDKIIGNPTPDWTLTSIGSFNYKDFTLSAQLEYTHGGENFSDLVEDLIERGVTRDTENREGSFIIPGVYGDPSTGLPFLDENGQTIPNTIQLDADETAFSNFYNPDDNSVFDTSVFRIREIALAYNLNRRKFSKLPFESATFTLSGRNIFYNAPGFPKYTNIDPELDTSRGTTVPTTRRFAFSVSISF